MDIAPRNLSLGGGEVDSTIARLLTGALLSFARSLGEFGAIVFVSGNIPNKTLTAPVLITQLLNPTTFGAVAGPGEAAAVSSLLFGLSFVLVLVTERLSSHSLERAAEL